ncbi:MAG: hypothetical protein A2Y77_00080 [Planctomycetes bacterium RBG_13_62_9]|nr:MAG: hypothetical protein A2Y77_00080 [Planctomycetes bacterium RBG_13_62_9]
MSVTKRLRRYFLRGLAVLLPALLTLWILAWGYGQVQRKVAVHINRGVVEVLVWAQRDNLPKEALDAYKARQIERFVEGASGSIVGVLIAILIIVLVGALLASVVGRALWRIIESFILNTPVLRRVYPYVKQVTDFVLPEDDHKTMFSQVVAVEYPRKGIWSLGFVTGSGLRAVAEKVGKEFLTVMIPTSPTPVTGWVITVPKEETIALDMTVEEALRFIISAGVISPDSPAPLALAGARIEQEKCP